MIGVVPTSATGEMWFDWGGDALMLVAHTKKSPEAATWSEMCAAVADALRTTEQVRTLVFTDGGGPSSAQRDELARVTTGKKYRVSVVSSAPAVRFIVSSMALFNPTIRSFLPADWRRGLAHLELGVPELRKVEQSVRHFASRPHGDRFAVLNAVLASKR